MLFKFIELECAIKMANQTRVIIGICVVVTLVMFGVGVLIGFLLGKPPRKLPLMTTRRKQMARTPRQGLVQIRNYQLTKQGQL